MNVNLTTDVKTTVCPKQYIVVQPHGTVRKQILTLCAISGLWKLSYYGNSSVLGVVSDLLCALKNVIYM